MSTGEVQLVVWAQIELIALSGRDENIASTTKDK